ncbi:MAG: succinate dehydrogenase [Hyphomicrobiaceae bacterium]
MSAVRLYVWQRLMAMLLVPLIAVHLIVIIYATNRGLSAAEILGRTRGSLAWGLYYSLFVAAASIHGAIGVRGVAREWLGWREKALDRLMWIFGGVLVVLGLRAVLAVVVP